LMDQPKRITGLTVHINQLYIYIIA